jgi:hypothetical protein
LLAISVLLRPKPIPQDGPLQWGRIKLTEENARLRRLVAELSLDKAVLQDVLSKKFPGQRS